MRPEAIDVRTLQCDEIGRRGDRSWPHALVETCLEVLGHADLAALRVTTACKDPEAEAAPRRASVATVSVILAVCSDEELNRLLDESVGVETVLVVEEASSLRMLARSNFVEALKSITPRHGATLPISEVIVRHHMCRLCLYCTTLDHESAQTNTRS